MGIQLRFLALTGLSAALFLTNPTTSRSALLIVPDHYATIQSAFNAAASGDSIMVRVGTYVEALVLSNKDVTLFGESGAEATIITTNSTARVLDIGAGVTLMTVLSDLTIRDGFAEDGGGIVLKDGASLVLRRNRLLSNTSFRLEGSSWGGAVLVGNGSSLIVEDCFFEENVADCVCGETPGQGIGGAVSVSSGSNIRVARTAFVNNSAAGFEGGFGGAIHVGSGASAIIEDCSFRGNLGYGGGVGSNGNITIERCVFSGHWGYSGAAVLSWGGQSFLRENLFFDNENWGEGGVIDIVYPGAPGHFRRNTVAFNTGRGVSIYQDVVENNIIVGNADTGLSCYNQAPGSITCNDIWNNSVNYAIGCPDLTGVDGNISLDPSFCNAEARDLRLRNDSPCAPGASGVCGLIGALEVGCIVEVESGESAFRAARLLPLRPNPTLTPAVFAFELPSSAAVQIMIYDAMGRRTAALADGMFATGRHKIVWPARTDDGRDLGSGVYFLRFETGSVRQTERIVLIR